MGLIDMFWELIAYCVFHPAMITASATSGSYSSTMEYANASAKYNALDVVKFRCYQEGGNSVEYIGYMDEWCITDGPDDKYPYMCSVEASGYCDNLSTE